MQGSRFGLMRSKVSLGWGQLGASCIHFCWGRHVIPLNCSVPFQLSLELSSDTVTAQKTSAKATLRYGLATKQNPTPEERLRVSR
jgi:hypothetical protein